MRPPGASRRLFALVAVGLAAAGPAGCRRAARPVALEPLPIRGRFAVGVIPDHVVGAPLGEAILCRAVFPGSDVIALEREPGGEVVPRIVKEGLFTGTCNGVPLGDAFEARKVAAARIETSAIVGNSRPFEIPLTHPAQIVRLRAVPLDGTSTPLDAGRRDDDHPGYARWRLGPGCERVVKISGFGDARPGQGFGWPADDVVLAGVGAGVCPVDVDYLGARSDARITVR